MDPLDFLEPDELLRFFRRSKTEMSLMEKPYTFLSQLKDHKLIPDDIFKKVTRMKSGEKSKKAIYDILDCFERERPKEIPLFWKCVFKDTILNQYHTLKMLHNSIMDGTYHFDTQILEVEETETTKTEGLTLPEDEEPKTNSVSKKRKVRSKSVSSDENEQPGPSSRLTPSQKKKAKKILFSSALKKGEKGDIWNWPIYKSQLPVTCGGREGLLIRDKLAKGERCIWAEKEWFTPTEFEKLTGKGSNKNWKWSIRCQDTPLLTLIKEGNLKSSSFRRRKKVKKFLFSSSDSATGNSEDEEEHQDSSIKTVNSSEEEEENMDTLDEQASATNPDSDKVAFLVTCGALSGQLHKKRFASGRCGKSIRTETRWLTPLEFVYEALGQRDGSWMKDIEYDRKPIGHLIKNKMLYIHSDLCICCLCKPSPKDLENEKNDDECYVCKSNGELVKCDLCPRSFHQKCHVPQVKEQVIKEDKPWMCIFCSFKSIQELLYPDEQKLEDVMTHQISRHMVACPYLLLFVYSADENQIFATNPEEYLKAYTSIIKTPMWLGKMAEKLQEKLYKTLGEFLADFELIFTNCTTYNKNNAEFHAVGKHLKLLLDQEIRKVFNIPD
ncbi:nuclear body protein SP140-like protein isoform X1 [Nothobranchius furzeri]|uniref:Nuclear body protein SP140-like n=4 Tax=Nothobranchius furzeri TaxID=105023 RepID=A0A1A8URR5_NOTFU|nr:nuclear body protein SP140-like [Nothobranchius furzeri]